MSSADMGQQATVSVPLQAEFDGAFLRLMERYGALCWDSLTDCQREQVNLLADDSAAFKRWDQDVLRDWAAAKGIDMSTDAYKPNAPILYMAKLLQKHGYTRPEQALAALYDERLGEYQ